MGLILRELIKRKALVNEVQHLSNTQIYDVSAQQLFLRATHETQPMLQDEFINRSSLQTETLRDVTDVVARSQCEFCESQA